MIRHPDPPIPAARIPHPYLRPYAPPLRLLPHRHRLRLPEHLHHVEVRTVAADDCMVILRAVLLALYGDRYGNLYAVARHGVRDIEWYI